MKLLLPKKINFQLILIIFSLFICDRLSGDNIKLIETRKIWDKANHNAFTDLEYFRGHWYCAFREGNSHAGSGDYGKVRVIKSADGTDWKSVALFSKDKVDLRDAKLSITPKNRLLLNSCEYRVDNDSNLVRNNTSVTFLSSDGIEWSNSNQIADPKFWVWQNTWNKGTGYALGYRWGEKDMTRLYKTTNGINYIEHLDHLRPPGDKSNEHALFFGNDDTAHMLLRRDNPSSPTRSQALLGTALPPYQDWEWRRLNVRIGGPSIIQIAPNKVIACIRRYGNKNWTELGLINIQKASYEPAIRLPSGGDTSYAGLVWRDMKLWISYYSSHEGKTSIYLSKAIIE